MRIIQRSLALVITLGLGAGTGASSPAAASQVPSGPRSKPNIVFLLTDDQTYESLRAMPYVDGRRDWIRFNNAFINNPLCCPSRATILTGQYSHHTGVDTGGNNAGSRLDDSSTIATWLQAAGYRTGLFGKYLNQYPWRKPALYIPPGWTRWFAQYKAPEGPNHYYYDYAINDQGQVDSYGHRPRDYFTDVISREARTFMRKPSERPFFAYVAYTSPHSNRTPAPRYADDDVPEAPVKPSFNEADMSDKPEWMQALPFQPDGYGRYPPQKAYRANLAVDESVKKIFKTLRRSSQLRDTVVIFMTDNGFMYGEHRLKAKSCPYEECIHTPFLVRYPGRAGGREHGLVSNIDIAPTVAALAGIEPGGPVDGENIVPLIRGSQDEVRTDVLIHSDFVRDQPPGFWGVRTHGYTYIETEGTDETELYDLRNDPFELQSVAGDRAYAGLQSYLAGRLAYLKATPPHTARQVPSDSGSR
jgi:N-acetylglucosamine-6-sulfatase